MAQGRALTVAARRSAPQRQEAELPRVQKALAPGIRQALVPGVRDPDLGVAGFFLPRASQLHSCRDLRRWR
jgi:hypothetical protein